ncbi:hypothetical protein Bacsa_2372 [Phocaeicola salanitronis DSM 18170]|uniref:Uncharacterized protein n=1 Tax=Phocaeicola salanitronis (strain DSM 18170 / JCM 13657 / CCUG 60908 / BL78) TaxID=667015 RepID=F0R793_PHOSB|nr:hypothetical protein Bacsa_2372 [Phocaeicola salanitronis DSM 18170]
MQKYKNPLTTQAKSINRCYKAAFSCRIICRYQKSPYICNVFFIVLDLRLTKVGVQRYSFFYVRTLWRRKKTSACYWE